MQKLPILLLLLAVLNQEGGAFCVYNQQSHNAVVEIYGIYEEQFAAGEKKCCNWKDCGGSREKVLRVWIKANGVDQVIDSHAGGCIYITQDKTDWGWPKDSPLDYIIQSFSNKIDPGRPGKCTWEELDDEPYINTGGSRSVHFLATADTQYSTPETKAVPDQTIATMIKMLSSQYDGRGIIVAGDLVQWADMRWENFQAYKGAFRGMERALFDGMGNHDLDRKKGWENSIKGIYTTIADRRRATVTNKRTGASTPDYSWNWDDVHFVQLNHFPGVPGHGLAWLKSDLESNVGGSGNPIVMIHHYGFDGFSKDPKEKWWTDDDRKNYWDVIKGYNVIAFITGHLHTPFDLLQYWEGDDYLNGAKIPYFIAGAAMQHGGSGRGYFLEVTITESQLTVVRRYGNDGSENERASVGLKPTKKKPLVAKSQVIFEDIPRDGSILTIYPNPAVNELHVDVIENNTELVEGVEMFDRNGKLFDAPGGPYPANQLNFSISQLPPLDFYLLRVKMAGGAIEQRKFWKSPDEKDTGDP